MGSKTWKWEGLLVRVYEYSQDRLHREIEQLKAEILELEAEAKEQHDMTLMAEVLLCIISFAAGIIVAQMFL